jgi:16S rRNA (adenine1518-N6/adenine1519-N6)-dimethyltransferase
MIQEEVGDRILAAPGGKSYGALSVGVRSVFEARKVMRVSRGAFRPVPGVDSVVVRLDRIDPAPLSEAEEGDLRTLVRASFQWRRKQLGTILRRHPDLKMWRSRVDAALADAGLESRIRPEGLAPDRFLHLLRNLSAPESGGSGVTR